MGIFSKEEKWEPQNIKEILKQFADLKEDFKKVSQELQELKEQSKQALQKAAIKRYNPFREVGGDQSFSAALLDAADNGIVITSHYTRKENRIYGKPIKAGKSDYPLSEEEINVIETARNHDK
jgi:hypothetical protein